MLYASVCFVLHCSHPRAATAAVSYHVKYICAMPGMHNFFP